MAPSKKNCRSPKAGLRSSSQTASGSKRAKKGRPTQAGSRPWRKLSAKTLSPRTSATPWTSTLPGVADIEGPRTVRARPETSAKAWRKMAWARARLTAK